MSKTDCFDIEDLSRYCIGEGTGDWRQAVEAHLADCPVCRQELAALEAVPAVLANAPRCEAPDQWSSIAARLEPRRRWFAWPVLARPKAWAAAAGLAAVLASVGLQLGRAPEPPPAPSAVQHAEASDSDLARSHAALAWNDPFSDSASLAVMAVREDGSQGQ